MANKVARKKSPSAKTTKAKTTKTKAKAVTKPRAQASLLWVLGNPRRFGSISSKPTAEKRLLFNARDRKGCSAMADAGKNLVPFTQCLEEMVF